MASANVANTTDGLTITATTPSSSATPTPPTSSKAVLPPDSDVLPPVCFAICDTAHSLALTTGLTPPLCSPSSPFSQAFTSCTNCINTHAPSPSSVLTSNITPRFADYINYCALSFSQPLIGSLLTTITSLAAVESASIASKWSSMASIASSGGYFVVPTELLTVTTQTRTWRSTESDGRVLSGEETRTLTVPNLSAWDYTPPGPGGAATTGGSTDGGQGTGGLGLGVEETGTKDMAWVAGPVVGCLVGIGMVGAGLWVWMRRRRRKAREVKEGGEKGGGEDPLGKAQLHSECVERPMTPREMDGGRKTFWQMDEMAANEIPAAELPGDEVFWREEKGKVRPESGSSFSSIRKI
ncbi:hypothetical protein QBC34DRAFT_443182 [Podospora aff. communis PSN243]|uniref:Uncharacterized protein n=1 Tax=Podospora aff. communis PSN243 TaxID=3040156 RepID=A0AAV9G6I9_9PEZI|nr:hypothetical protein QBC34DRAFT_443182 [Podospora aff. communis PSN243]